MTISLPPEKLESIIQEAHQIQQTSPISLEKLSSLIGRMSRAAQTGVWRAPLYYRSLQRDQAISTHQCGKHRKRFQVTLSQESMTELIWWPSPHLHTFNGQPLRSVPFDLTISTDASLLGWGATWNGVTTGGRWLPQEGKSHINWLELKAAYLGLQALFNSQTSIPNHIILQMDNSTAVAYVNKRGGTRSQALSVQALDVRALVLGKGSWITAQHIPGSSNEVADAASRCFNNNLECPFQVVVKPRYLQASDQTVLPTISGPICLTNQPSSATICLSPSRSRSNSDGCLSQRLEQVEKLDIPTGNLATKDTQQDQCGPSNSPNSSPHWPGQPWFPQLLEMLVDYPRLLPQRPHLISLSFGPEKEHPLQHKLHLTVWPVSASAIAQRDFKQRLQEFSCPRGVRLPRNDILDRGTLEQAGVMNGRCVPLLPL
jgi:hypothetical protein